MTLLRMSVYWESCATMVTTALRPSGCISIAKVSVARVSMSVMVVSMRVLSDCGISCPDGENAENIVKDSEMKDKIAATDLTFYNEWYFCNIRIAYKIK